MRKMSRKKQKESLARVLEKIKNLSSQYILLFLAVLGFSLGLFGAYATEYPVTFQSQIRDELSTLSVNVSYPKTLVLNSENYILLSLTNNTGSVISADASITIRGDVLYNPSNHLDFELKPDEMITKAFKVSIIEHHPWPMPAEIQIYSHDENPSIQIELSTFPIPFAKDLFTSLLISSLLWTYFAVFRKEPATPLQIWGIPLFSFVVTFLTNRASESIVNLIKLLLGK